jgi:hypothetical protein
VQLITIKYAVDKTTVDQSNASVEKARQLTDQLKNSAQQYSQTANRGAKEYAGNIETVRQKMALLRAQIDLTARSDTRRLNDLISQYRKAKSEVDAFNKAVEGQTKAVGNSTNAFMGMYSAVRLILTAGLTRWLVDTTLEMARLQGQTEAVGNAFKQQIPNAELLLTKLRKATHGTVGDLELMQKALRAKNFGFDPNSLPALLEFAMVRAQQTGQSVDYLVNSIVDGIGRKSLRILDNLQISVSDIKKEMNGLSMEAATVAQVSEAMGRIASREIEKMGGFAENAATKADQITVAWRELRIELSKKIESGGILDFMKDVLNGAKLFIQAFPEFKFKAEYLLPHGAFVALNDALNDFRKNLQTLVKEQAAVNLALQEYTDWEKKANEERGKAVELAQRQIVANVERLNLNNKEIASWKKKIETLDDMSIADRQAIDEAKQAITYYEGQNIKLNKLNELLREYIVTSMAAAKATALNSESMEDWAKSIERFTITIDDVEIEWDRLRNLFKEKKIDLSGIDIEGIEIPVEIAPPSWEGGNEKAARFRLAMREWFKENQDDLIGEGISFTTDLLNIAVDAELAHYEQRLVNLQNFYDRQNLLAGDNERYKKELALREQRDTLKLEREKANAQKKARKLSIVIDTAASIARAWVNPGYPGAIPLSIFLAAQGATQAAIVDKTTPGFKDGVIDLKGPGTTKSDSIPAWLSRGESVMTAEETQSSMNTLKAIRAKKLDDKKLERIIAFDRHNSPSTIFDDTRLANIMSQVARNTAQNDWVLKGGLLYEAKKQGETFVQHQRLKVIK